MGCLLCGSDKDLLPDHFGVTLCLGHAHIGSNLDDVVRLRTMRALESLVRLMGAGVEAALLANTPPAKAKPQPTPPDMPTTLEGLGRPTFDPAQPYTKDTEPFAEVGPLRGATPGEIALDTLREMRDILGDEGSHKGFERLAKARILLKDAAEYIEAAKAQAGAQANE